MKRLLNLLAIAFACLSCTLLSSCAGEEEEIGLSEETIASYTQQIVGTWLKDGSQEYWRFDAAGSGSVGYGENWDVAEDVNEGEGNKFKWQFQSTGLKIEEWNTMLNDYQVIPGSPYSIKVLSSTRLIWTTSIGEEESFTKKK